MTKAIPLYSYICKHWLYDVTATTCLEFEPICHCSFKTLLSLAWKARHYIFVLNIINLVQVWPFPLILYFSMALSYIHVTLVTGHQQETNMLTYFFLLGFISPGVRGFLFSHFDQITHRPLYLTHTTHTSNCTYTLHIKVLRRQLDG